MGHNSSEPNVKKLKKERDIKGLIDAASGWSGSLEAVKALGEIGDKAAVPALARALRDGEGNVRWDAAEALGKIGKTAVPTLIKALKDEQWTVRMNAAKILGEISDDEMLS